MSDEPVPSVPANAEEADPPSLELKISAAISALPQLAALFAGGYGRVLAIVPVALALTLADGAALAVAALQLRSDRRVARPTHTLVWITIALLAPWLVYAVYIGAVFLMVQLLCVNQTCRGLIH